MKILKTQEEGNTRIQFVNQAGRNFRIHYQQISLDMFGYDIHRYKADIFNEQAGWVLLAGEQDIGFKRVKFAESEKHKQDAQAFFKAMREHIEILYPNQIR